MKIGYITVDSGTIHLGDLCYVLNENNTWEKYTEELSFKERYTELEHSSGMPGKGFNFSTGDGIFPVYATFDENGLVKEIKIKIGY